MSKILLVEDSSDYYNLVKRSLSGSINLQWAHSLGEARKAVRKNAFDLILLDVMLPDGDGFQLCSDLQAGDDLQKAAVIFLTSKSTITDKLLGFSVGGDDFITKPFNQTEFRARVEGRLRRREREKSESDTVKLGDIEINRCTQRVQIFDNGIPHDVNLTPIEFKLLLFLCKEIDRVYSREIILKSVWGDAVHVFSRSVDTHISKLRNKLGSKGVYIESVHGSGYRFSIEGEQKVSRSPDERNSKRSWTPFLSSDQLRSRP